MPIIIYIFDTTHNIQLGYEYKYIIFDYIFIPYGRITHVKCKMMDINFSYHILNNITPNLSNITCHIIMSYITSCHSYGCQLIILTTLHF
jgi:hypothetical protein